MNKEKLTRQESGVALLFALGLLSLLLVLGLGFFTSVSVAQKIASNTNNRSQAKMLGQSAVNRALMNLMIYQNEVFNNASYLPSDFTGVFSRGKYDINDGQTSGKSISNDYLLGTKSLLKYVNDLDEETNKDAQNLATASANPDSYPQWIYFYDRSDSKKYKRIIGRASYRIIPTTTKSKINLNTFVSEPLSYIVDNDDKNQKTPWYDTTVIDETKRAMTPESFRWGRDIDELDINQTLFYDDIYPSDWETANNRNAIPKKIEEIVEKFNLPPTSTDEAVLKKIEWVKKWFVDANDNNDPVANETFLSSDKSPQFKKRFNIGYIPKVMPTAGTAEANSFDNWYSRFNFPYTEKSDFLSIPNDKVQLNPDRHQNENWNNYAIVNSIGADANRFSEKNGLDEPVIASGSGMHFIKRITDKKGAFSSIELRRKQIVANLNDYCDSDNIPTSAIGENGNAPLSATRWKINNDSGVPVYTGNERTPYINEIAIASRITDLKLEDGKVETTGFSQTGNNLKYTLTINPNLVAELVKIYKDPQNSNELPFGGNYTFLANLKGIKITFKVLLKGNVKYNNSAGAEQELDFTENDVFTEKELTIDTPNILNIQFNNDPANKTFTENQGYLVNSIGLTSSNITIDSSEKLSEYFNSKVSSLTGITKVNVESAKIRITKFSITLGNMMLLGGLTSGTEATISNPGVDYVSARNASSTPETPQPCDITYIASDDNNAIEVLGGNLKFLEANGDNANFKFNDLDSKLKNITLGGIEARDPRQNLNLVINATTIAGSDWKVNLPNGWNGESGTLPSLDLTWNNSTSKFTILGKKNSCSDPSNPEGYSQATNFPYNFDKETATDVAWTGDSKGQHLSTAFIRNAPMWSPWELGAIHRGAAWETINLKSATPIDSSNHITAEDMRLDVGWDSTTGTSYAGGDGALLEQIKMTNDSKANGKIDISLLWKGAKGHVTVTGDPQKESADDRNILKALFNGIKIGGGYPTKQNLTAGNAITISNSSIDALFDYNDNNIREKQNMRTDVLNWEINGSYWYQAFNNTLTLENDADQEEIVGRTINLLTCSPSLPNTIQLLVIAQTIKDIGKVNDDENADDEPGEIEVTKFSKKHPHSATIKCKLGRFDYAYIDENGGNTKDDKNITYFDEITGEIKMLVTIDRDPLTGRMAVRTIEYVE